ncbi:hypothetical protein [Novipirellula artificiosorum]|uniref:Uncharacterized protein n=1 Tax=Novipirellula artificiosorum TaxID=2528016 RepID=A0A5C6DBY4_9BACT|nr:hypothetical protein [Novipirellula artificiosorum]TWU33364.1 hypothetical protein Poly41_51180 [Novipirellula artificiosorum]
MTTNDIRSSKRTCNLAVALFRLGHPQAVENGMSDLQQGTLRGALMGD